MERNRLLLIPMLAVLPLAQAGCGDDGETSAAEGQDDADVSADVGGESGAGTAGGEDGGSTNSDVGEGGDAGTDAYLYDEEEYYEYLEETYGWPPPRPPASRDDFSFEAARAACEFALSCYDEPPFESADTCVDYWYPEWSAAVEEAEARSAECLQATLDYYDCFFDAVACDNNCGRQEYRRRQACAVIGPPPEGEPFQCGLGMEIPASQVCDGTVDCPMGEDESTMTCLTRPR